MARPLIIWAGDCISNWRGGVGARGGKRRKGGGGGGERVWRNVRGLCSHNTAGKACFPQRLPQQVELNCGSLEGRWSDVTSPVVSKQPSNFLMLFHVSENNSPGLYFHRLKTADCFAIRFVYLTLFAPSTLTVVGYRWSQIRHLRCVTHS